MLSIRTFAAVIALLAVGLVGAAPALGNEVHHGLHARAIHGDIMSINGNLWMVDTEHHGNLNVDVSRAKIKWPGRPNATLSDFRVGDTVNVKLGRKHHAGTLGDPLKARVVHFVPNGHLARLQGTVSGVSSGSLTVNLVDDGSRTFTLNGTTTVRLMLTHDLLGIGDIKIGDTVTVVTRENDSLALMVRIRARA